jgi:ATP-dependent exoDNAse (exonuclease V) beta subunit
VKHTLSENELFNCYSVHGTDNDNFFDLLFKIIGEKKSSIENEIKQFSLNNKIRTIAILVRNNWQVDLIVEEAKKRNLFIEVNSGGDLYELDSTHDLYKLVLALVHNHESVYLINFIRSNFVNVKLNFDELYSMSESEKYAILTDLLNNYFTQKMNISWAHIIKDINIQPILFTIRNIYNKLMPWTKFSSNYYRQKHYIENYELLFEKIINFTRVDALTINEIYKFLKINILTGQKAFSRSGSVENDGIRIICTTVHKSKGLEYGTVIMPYTNDDISDPKNVKLEANYVNDQLSYYVKFNKKIDEYNNNFDYTQEISEQMCEESRILYVGMTRAIRNFIWINNVDRNTKISWNEMMEVANEH